MAPPFWANDRQKAFLEGWVPDYIRRQAERKLHLFWAPMMETWFKQFAEHTTLDLSLPNDANGRTLTPDELATLGAAILARKGQLENWFRNRRKSIGNASGSTATATSATVKNIFKISIPKRRRAHQPIEIFQKNHQGEIRDALTAAGYDDLNEAKMADDIDEGTDESEDTVVARIKATKSKRMRLRTQVVQDLWKEVSEAERELIEAEVAKEKEELREEDGEREEKSGAQKSTTPAELQDGVDALEGVYSEIHKATYNASGWVGMTTMHTICFGETPAGNDFEDSCVDFDKNVVEAFEAFLRNCYSLDECRSRAFMARPDAAHEPRLERVAPAISESASAEEKKAKKPKCVRRKKNAKSAAIVPQLPSSLLATNDGALANDGLASNSVLPSDDNLSTPGDVDYFEGSDSPPDDMGGEDVVGTPFSPLPPQPLMDMQPGTQPWPPGMSPPLTPAQAAAIALLERGGILGDGPTMAIDPQLEALSVSSHLLLPPTVYPWTLPAFSGTASTPTIVPSNGAPSAGSGFKPSLLFEAFRNTGAAPPTPIASRTWSATPAPMTPWYAASPRHASKTAEVLAGLAAAGNTTPVADAPVAPPPLKVAHVVPPIAPDAPVAPSVVLPLSRPMAKPVPAKKTKRVFTAAADKREVAAEEAVKVAVVVEGAKKRRGRPRKDAVDEEGTVLGALADATNTQTATAAPVPMFTITNNNRREAQRAAAAEKAKEKKAVQEALEKQAARGWIETADPDQNAVVVLTRTCKPTKFADGTFSKPPKKKNLHAASEAALLARTEAGKAGKRKSAVEPQKARKNYSEYIRNAELWNTADDISKLRWEDISPTTVIYQVKHKYHTGGQGAAQRIPDPRRYIKLAITALRQKGGQEQGGGPERSGGASKTIPSAREVYGGGFQMEKNVLAMRRVDLASYCNWGKLNSSWVSSTVGSMLHCKEAARKCPRAGREPVRWREEEGHVIIICVNNLPNWGFTPPLRTDQQGAGGGSGGRAKVRPYRSARGRTTGMIYHDPQPLGFCWSLAAVRVDDSGRFSPDSDNDSTVDSGIAFHQNRARIVPESLLF
ncbi:hypothetical protein B0H11DRAFT_2204602 [Mycena galericulata]|nr:hypothetical protein B0H11DRAFT_2204602 [Mycena galericulata]